MMTARELAEIRAMADALLDGEYGPLPVARDSTYGPRLTGEDAHNLRALCEELDLERKYPGRRARSEEIAAVVAPADASRP